MCAACFCPTCIWDSSARARKLADFLAAIESETILLAGDIVDCLSLARRFFWSADHSRVVHALLAKRRCGARLIYLPGNHDADRGPFVAMMHGAFEVHREWVHHTARGERLLVLRGDQFDDPRETGAWLHWLGDWVYELTIVLNGHLNDLLGAARLPYWPLAQRLKLAVATSARFIERFEAAAIDHALGRGYDGIVCGHIHRANLRRVPGLIYCNTGDWVESCSALIEDHNGELRLWRLGESAQRSLEPTPSLLADAPEKWRYRQRLWLYFGVSL